MELVWYWYINLKMADPTTRFRDVVVSIVGFDSLCG